MLKFDKGRWGCESLLELTARVEDLQLRGCPGAGPGQAVVLLLRLVCIGKGFAGRGLAGDFLVVGVLCLFVLSRLPQGQGLLSQEV